MKKDLIDIRDLTREDIDELIALAREFVRVVAYLYRDRGDE